MYTSSGYCKNKFDYDPTNNISTLDSASENYSLELQNLKSNLVDVIYEI